MGRRKHGDTLEFFEYLTCQRMQLGKRLDFVTEHLNANGELFVYRDDFDGIAADPECSPEEGDIVSLILHTHECPSHFFPGDALADVERQHRLEILFGRTQAVDAAHSGDDDDVAPRKQRVRRGVPQTFHFGVDGRVLLDEGICLRHVRLRLVIVVIGDEVLNGVARKELPQLVGKLGCQCLVMRHDQGGPLQTLNQPCGGGRLSGTGRTQKSHIGFTGADSLFELIKRCRLVTTGPIVAHDLKGPDGTRGFHAPMLVRNYGSLLGREPTSGQCSHRALASNLAPSRVCSGEIEASNRQSATASRSSSDACASTL